MKTIQFAVTDELHKELVRRKGTDRSWSDVLIEALIPLREIPPEKLNLCYCVRCKCKTPHTTYIKKWRRRFECDVCHTKRQQRW